MPTPPSPPLEEYPARSPWPPWLGDDDDLEARLAVERHYAYDAPVHEPHEPSSSAFPSSAWRLGGADDDHEEEDYLHDYLLRAEFPLLGLLRG